ncbi:MAG: N-acetylmuramoyl-L-alanine amidase [Melioribacteraceae bacterium]|nr:N-acetylmuramoyl-L-alanine amidase [Melioribacteraceae bacterium]
MKKFFLLFLLWAVNIITGQNFYKDKFVSIEFENYLTLENKLNEINSINIDALVVKSLLTKELINLKKDDLVKLKSVLEKIKNKEIYFEIDFSNPQISFQNISIIKKNINQFVSIINFRGFIFSNINLNDELNYSIFENIVAEAAIVKPHLHTLINKNSFDESKQAGLISKGIVDFIFDVDKILRNDNFKEDFVLKTYLKKLSPFNFYKLNISEVINSTQSYLTLINNKSKIFIDIDYNINFILTEISDTIKFQIDNSIFTISKNDWVIPYNYKINKEGLAFRIDNWIEFRRPFERITSNNIYNLLCKTTFPSTVKINDEDVKIYKTGVFFKKINLNVGLNKLKAEAINKNGSYSIYEDEILLLNKMDNSDLLTIDELSIYPNENLQLTKNDFIIITFNGTKSQKGFVEVLPSNKIYPCQSKNFSNSTQYSVQLNLSDFPENENLSFKLILQSSTNENEKIYKQLKHTITIKNQNEFPHLITNQDYSLLAYTLAPIRLGAPLRNELPKNVILKSNGIFGDYYRIKLNDSEEGYIHKEFVKELSNETVQPGYYISSITSFTDTNYDVVRIPYLENVPYDIYFDPQLKRITISLYGVKTSSTWIIHKPNLRYIQEITWQQTSKETYKIYINLNTNKIWGFEIKPNGNELLARIKYPPNFNLKSKLPLKGIKISIEAGHGGTNTGAIGLSGMKEKELNLDLTKKLETLFKKFGAEVYMVRDSDKDMTLLEKRTLAINSGANIHFSIHANSSEPTNEFLGANGTSTFYNNPFWAPLAEKVFYKLTELNLAPFGSVGSFNYRVSRINEMPSILVEQAFMSHAEDEEKLADENFRNKMAQKIYEGLIDYLKYMSEK